ncbi:uncharacterized protein ACA1_061110 [Acanthamoeba castellanii str. Neff]|uniref:Uncharacterized protein n=1 Tax=Acanthamoeba castellanii (strain ATCC 30010 / Neff) TaxID=1257118 RepID=L8GXT4_ACACF|nr:uncharacterized protein ACA1_061110 [Acanthamoeba castellanii str. Neff]ELR17373.1 hypothetical protein ACA1_061110 [Acanthamoeba castellanii str. Neff]
MDELPPPIAQSIKSVEEANSVLSELEIHLQDQADRLLKKSYLLGALTGCEVALLFSFKGQVKSYASPQLEPLITEKQAKDLFTNLLYGQKQPAAAATGDQAAAPSADSQLLKESPNGPAPTVGAPLVVDDVTEEELDAAEYLEDDSEREKAFKSRYVQLHNDCVRVSVVAHPAEGADVFLLVATPSNKIFSFTTPKLTPMIKTPIGQNMIKTFLNAKPAPAAATSSS